MKRQHKKSKTIRLGGDEDESSDSGRSTRRRLNFNVGPPRETMRAVVNWINDMPGELWQLALEKGPGARLDFEWIGKFARINKDCYRYTLSKELWRYLYECELVAPAARPSDAFDPLTNASTQSYSNLREESDIHFEMMRAYVFHYGKKEDIDGNVYARPSDLPEWKVWKRLVEVLRRRRLHLIDKTGLSSRLYPDAFLQEDDPSVVDTYKDSSTARLSQDYTTLVEEAEEIRVDRNLLYAEQDTLNNFTTVEYDAMDEGNDALAQEGVQILQHLGITKYVSSRTLPCCPWPIVYNVSWIGVLLPHKEIVGVGFPSMSAEHVSAVIDAYGHTNVLFDLVPHEGGLLSILCQGLGPAPTHERVLVAHTIRLDALIACALERLARLPRANTVVSLRLYNEGRFSTDLGRRVTHGLDSRIVVSFHAGAVDDAQRAPPAVPRFPMARLYQSRYFMPVSLSASRRYLAFGFHQGVQVFEWSRSAQPALVTRMHDFIPWSFLGTPQAFPPVSAHEPGDSEIQQHFLRNQSILPYLSQLTHDVQDDLVNLLMDAPELQLKNSDNVILPAVPRIDLPNLQQMRAADTVEVCCDPLGSNRVVLVVGFFEYAPLEARSLFFTNHEDRLRQRLTADLYPYAPVYYLVVALNVEQVVAQTRANYIFYHATTDIAEHKILSYRFLRPSLDGVAILLPHVRRMMHTDRDPRAVRSKEDRVRLGMVAWIDITAQRRSTPLLMEGDFTVPSTLLKSMQNWAYLSGGLLVLTYSRPEARLANPRRQPPPYERNEDYRVLVMTTSLLFIMAVRGGWRSKIRDKAAKIVRAVDAYTEVVGRIGHSSIVDTLLCAGGNTMVSLNYMKHLLTDDGHDYSVGVVEFTYNTSRHEIGPNTDSVTHMEIEDEKEGGARDMDSSVTLQASENSSDLDAMEERLGKLHLKTNTENLLSSAIV